MSRSLNSLAALFVIALALPAPAQTKPAAHKPFGFGTAATQEQIAGLNIHVRGPMCPGQPPVKGPVADDAQPFRYHGSACRGDFPASAEGQHDGSAGSGKRRVTRF